MKDSLEKFVEKNREAFDDKLPSEKVWKAVENQLPGRRISLWNNVIVWRVAAVLFLGLSVYLFINQPPIQQTKKETARLQGEFSDLEMFYSDQLAEKAALISSIQEFQDDNQFTQDVQKLEAMYQVLREQMKTQPTEKVKDALILNLLVRIDLLNQQIKKIEDTRKKNKEAAEV